MTWTRRIIGGLTIAAALVAANATPVEAQDRAVSLFARGGGFNGLTDLADGGAADFHKTGFNVGGGVGVELTRYVALRGDFTFARNELRTDGTDTGDELNRYFYEAAVQLQYPTARGLKPYVFAGGGAVTVDEVGSGGENDTAGAGTVGLGLQYAIPGSGLGVFIEGRGWLFGTDNLNAVLAPYDKTQFELAWTGGFSYRFPI